MTKDASIALSSFSINDIFFWFFSVTCILKAFLRFYGHRNSNSSLLFQCHLIVFTKTDFRKRLYRKNRKRRVDIHFVTRLIN